MLKKLRFAKSGEEKELNDPFPRGTLQPFIETIEIKSPNPSEVSISISGVDFTTKYTRAINLVEYRTQFVLQNGVYILNTGKIPLFNELSGYSNLKVSFNSINTEKPLDIEVFYALKQPASIGLSFLES